MAVQCNSLPCYIYKPSKTKPMFKFSPTHFTSTHHTPLSFNSSTLKLSTHRSLSLSLSHTHTRARAYLQVTYIYSISKLLQVV
ncbi:hypothetical protein CsSME_00037207 [Camellia sinensis var. sinensis]